MNENYTLKYKGQKIDLLRRDIPGIINDLEKAIKVYCVGLTNVVYDNKGKIVGHIGFWDFDGFFPSYDLRARICQITQALKTTVFALKTKAGYHFISFEIFDKQKYYEWKKIMHRIFPSDYITKDGNQVLRITSKGPENPVPQYETMYSFQSEKTWSSAHLKIYLERKIIPENVTELLKPKILNTQCQLCYYSTGVF